MKILENSQKMTSFKDNEILNVDHTVFIKEIYKEGNLFKTKLKYIHILKAHIVTYLFSGETFFTLFSRSYLLPSL